MALQIPAARGADIDLPSLGDTTSGIISPQQEHELGRAWLRVYRSRVPNHDDPQLQDYLERLLFRLASYSELQDHRLELILINNPSMNAFAVPGGIVGVHTGLFRFAESEHQLASVLAHEIAHLSQRHFARRVEEQRKNSITSLAGMLASLVLAATVGGDAGIAAMTATQAAALENSLRYSRQNEQEADRIGMQTIHTADMDPKAVPDMFERMLRATRYTGSRPPEFLLTHPLTEKRIADARNRIAKYPPKQYLDNIEYHLMRARAMVAIAKTPQQALQRFKSELEGVSLNREASQYGLALALTATADYAAAREALKPLLEKSPDRLTYQLADIDIDRASKQFDKAIAKATSMLTYHPANYPLKLSMAETYLKADRYEESEQVLQKLTKVRPNDPYIWFQLAEVRGLAGNISGVHQARAEYFILNGVFDQAREQLGYAKKLVERDYKQSSIIEQRLRDLAELQERTEKL